MDTYLELVTVGHIINEIVVYPRRTIGPVLGSPAAYTSVASAKLGTKTGIVTKVGKDIPEYLLKPFYEVGLDIRGLKVEGDVTTTNYLIYDNRGNKTLKYLKKAPPIFYEDIPKEYLKSKVFHICPMDFEVPIDTLKILSELGLRLSVDLGGYGGATSSKHPCGNTSAKRLFEDILKHFEIVRASLEDCMYLFGERKDLHKYALNSFIDKGAEIGLVTLGNRGVAILKKDGDYFEIPGFETGVVDVTGAGDTFCAGFLSEYIKTEDVLKSALFGCSTASLVIEKSGGVAASRMPVESEVRNRISHQKSVHKS
jgi:sugar/nucleoside kinase (ribokinase family)